VKTTHRDYAEIDGDFVRLCHFVQANHAAVRADSTWCLGRLVDWRYGLYPGHRIVPAFCDTNAHLWFDAFGDLAAFAVSEEGDAGFALITGTGYRFLFEEMLDWALAHWANRSGSCGGATAAAPVSVEIPAAHELGRRALEAHGFRQASAFCARHFDLAGDLPPRPVLGPGFSIVDMAAHPDYRAQRLMRADAFGGRDSLSEEELRHQVAFYDHRREGPIYHAPADLCVMAPDGTLVSGCEALIDARNLDADVERVCTRAAYRRRGLARAVIVECFYRLRDMGIRRAHIAGYSPEAIALYGSLGHVSESTFLVYQRVVAS
jgi:GNAT superfamily N-acetyltransferase